MKKEKNRWNRLFALSLAVICLALAFSGWTVYRHARGAAPDAPQETVAASYFTEQGTLPAVAAASWQPAPQLLDQNTAAAPSLEKTALEDLVNKGFRSVILPNALGGASASALGQVKEALDYLGDQGVFRTLTVPAVADDAFVKLGTELTRLIQESSFDALLVQDSPAADADGQGLIQFMGSLNQLLKDAELQDIPLKFEVPGSLKETQAYLESLKGVAGTLLKPEFLVQVDDASAKLLDGLKKALGADEKAGPRLSAVVNVKEAIPNGTLEEVVGFLESLQLCKDYPLVLQTADYVPKSEQAAKLLSQFFSNDLDLSAVSRQFSLVKPLKTLKAEQTIHADKPEINFTGSSNPLFPLLINGKELPRNESGDFTVDFPLQPGKNDFTFTHQDNTFAVHVVYDVMVLERVSPRSALETTGGIDLAVSAVARRGAVVRASLNGQVISLKPGAAIEEDGAEPPHEESDSFITYVGVFQLPNSNVKQSLGALSFSASYQGVTDTKSGGRVSLLPDILPEPQLPEPEVPPETPPDPTWQPPSAPSWEPPSQWSGDEGEDPPKLPVTDPPVETPPVENPPAGALLTPETNHGLGTAKMIRVKADYANCHWSGGTDTRSVPTSSPLLAGTYDYITGSTTNGGDTYYALASGKRANAKDLDVLNAGYRLPLNVLAASGENDGGAYVLCFGVNWKVPFNVTLLGQSYSSSLGFSGYTYGVSNFTATAVELTFYHTSGYSGLVNAATSALFHNAEWSKDTAKNTVTLKLSLRNPGKFYGYKASYEGGQLVLRMRPKPSPTLNGTVIYLDAGHGGSDPGMKPVASHDTMVNEKNITLAIALKLKAKLEAKGAGVVMTRTDDSSATLETRAARARAANPDLFLSLHVDSASSATSSGTTAFYYKPYGQPLAKAVHEKLVSAYKTQIYTAANYPGEYAAMQNKADHGTYFYPFLVTRIEECPAILIEYGFGTNLTECRALQKDQYQDILAQATADGIAAYLSAAQ
ncbi:MAG: N-acetylmuramoyl-L-alanine amidase [Oscillospiraceae bacterium]|nr:N-acetylmuramoyl-L-alanine amidase [Oscillospiraceae bacterium]